jgi:hypothetical protein
MSRNRQPWPACLARLGEAMLPLRGCPRSPIDALARDGRCEGYVYSNVASHSD